jgi:hypothetical protein
MRMMRKAHGAAAPFCLRLPLHRATEPAHSTDQRRTAAGILQTRRPRAPRSGRRRSRLLARARLDRPTAGSRTYAPTSSGPRTRSRTPPLGARIRCPPNLECRETQRAFRELCQHGTWARSSRGLRRCSRTPSHPCKRRIARRPQATGRGSGVQRLAALRATSRRGPERRGTASAGGSGSNLCHFRAGPVVGRICSNIRPSVKKNASNGRERVVVR